MQGTVPIGDPDIPSTTALSAVAESLNAAAITFNCSIHLVYSKGVGDRRYLFEPQSQKFGSEGLPNIFLKAKKDINKAGRWSFYWFQIGNKPHRSKSLWSALFNWLHKPCLRPMTVDVLGKSERQFIEKCADIVKRAHDNPEYTKLTMPLVVMPKFSDL